MAVDRKKHPFFKGRWPIVVGHRGAAGTRPENTLISFARALEEGADMIECDLRLTKDGAVVILHDPTVDRTTNGTGSVSDYTLAELKKLDAGYNFTADGGQTYPFRGQGITVPTLREVMDAFPDTRFCFELKGKSRELVEKTIDLVISNKRAEKTLLGTFNHAAQRHIYRYLRRTGADIPVTGSKFESALALIGSKTGLLPPPRKVDILSVPPENRGIRVLSPRFNEYAHRHDRMVFAWTIDDPADIEAFLAQGVDAIITNYPARAVPLVEKARAPGAPGI